MAPSASFAVVPEAVTDEEYHLTVLPAALVALSAAANCVGVA